MMDDGSPREETNPTPTHVSRFDKGSAVGRAVLHEIIGYSDTYILAELNPEQFELIAWLLSENEAHVREKKFVVQKKVEELKTFELLKKVNESYDKKSVQLSRFLYELDLLSLHNIIRLYGMRERINIVYEKDFALAFNLLRYFLERESIKLSGSLVNQIDSQGYTPLMRLSNFLNDQISRDTIDRLRHLNAYGSLLLSYGADPRAVTPHNKNTVLHKAVIGGSYKFIEDLIRRGAEVNALNTNQRAPLHLAAFLGRRTIVELLLRYGANANQLDKDRCSPLHLALGTGRQSVIKMLIRSGATINSPGMPSELIHFVDSDSNSGSSM